MPPKLSDGGGGAPANIQGPSIRTDRLKFVLGKPNCAHEDKQNILRLMQMPASYGGHGASLMEIIYQACGFPYEVMYQATDPGFESSFWEESGEGKQTDYAIKKYADLHAGPVQLGKDLWMPFSCCVEGGEARQGPDGCGQRFSRGVVALWKWHQQGPISGKQQAMQQLSSVAYTGGAAVFEMDSLNAVHQIQSSKVDITGLMMYMFAAQVQRRSKTVANDIIKIMIKREKELQAGTEDAVNIAQMVSEHCTALKASATAEEGVNFMAVNAVQHDSKGTCSRCGKTGHNTSSCWASKGSKAKDGTAQPSPATRQHNRRHG